MSDTASGGNVAASSTSKEPIEPAFEVGPPGVGPVTGIHTGEFFESPPEDPVAERDARSDSLSTPALNSPNAPAVDENQL